MTRHIHFVTGRLAESSLRQVVAELADTVGFRYSIDVMPISVAALLTPRWIAPRLRVPPAATEIVLPGYCDSDLTPIQEVTKVPVRVGPRELRALPHFFGQQRREDYGRYSVEIIAEINHAPRLGLDSILKIADHYRKHGADVIDVGCEPGTTWDGVAHGVAALRQQGHRVSIDSFHPAEVSAAVDAGAELVLSVNASNRTEAIRWGCEVVAIPDDPQTLEGLEETIEFLASHNVSFRVDPILEPIGCGFAASLGRYLHVRQRYPDVELMMGIGNLTELTDVDSAGVNAILLGFCEEVGVRSVLTTEVINWARSSVRECDLARRLVHFAVKHATPPKRVQRDLLMLRDDQLYPQGEPALRLLAQSIKDHNYRVFAEADVLHVMAAGIHLRSDDPFELFEQLMETSPRNMDPSHAFYLGYELCKAVTALTLSKQYRQDQALDWGFLTRPERNHRQP